MNIHERTRVGADQQHRGSGTAPGSDPRKTELWDTGPIRDSVSGTPAEGLGNLFDCRTEMPSRSWRPRWRPSSNGESAPSLLDATWGRASRLESHNRPVNGYRAETADSNQHQWPTPIRERLPFDLHPMKILCDCEP